MTIGVPPRVANSTVALLLVAAAGEGASTGALAATDWSGVASHDLTMTEQSMVVRQHAIEVGLLTSGSILPFGASPKREGQVASETATTRSRAKVCPVAVVRMAQRGDKRAFAQLWERYAPTVNSILRTMVRESDADDLTQEVAVAALRALPDLEKPQSFPAWLATIARNMGRDALRLQRESNDAPIAAAQDIVAVPSGDTTEADEIIAQIRNLPECHREPLMLRLLLGLTGPEIAEQIGMTEGSVRVNLCRGMKLLRQRLKDWE